MGLINNLKAKGNRLLAREASELSRLQRTVRFCIRLALHCTRQLSVCRAGQMAAALTYHTLFSLLPTIALMLVLARVFVSDAQLTQLTDNIVDVSLQWLDESSVEPDSQDAPITTGDEPAATADPAEPELTGSPDAANQTAVAANPAAAEGVASPPPGSSDSGADSEAAAVDTSADPSRDEAFDIAAQAVRSQIEVWIEQLRSINFSSIGVFGALFFIYGATALLATIERSFNRIYDTDAARPIQIRVPMYFTVIVMAPLVLVAGQVVRQQLEPYLMIDTLASAAEGLGPISWLFTWVGSTITPTLTMWLVLMAMYVLLPTAKVSVRHAAVGSAVAAIGWTLLVELFGLYVRRFTAEDGSGQGKLYGALALLPLFLLWLYLTWIIILFGIILTRTLQNLKGWEIARQRRASTAGQLVSPDAVVPAMVLLARRFDTGKSLDRDDLARELDLPVPATGRLVDALIDAGLLHHVADGSTDVESSPITLSRPPQRVALTEVLDIGDHLARGGRTSDTPSAEAVLECLTKARRQAVAGQTLADAAGLADPRQATAPPAPTHAQPATGGST
ncbi:MAG: YihY/virulence factor BrkB family protein [Planctomycetota bacterium]